MNSNCNGLWDMVDEDILKFSEFLDYYKDKYAKTSSEISMPKPNDTRFYKDESEELKPLVASDFIMLDFDLMCDDANFYPKESEEEINEPSTVDALYYRIIDDFKIEFFLVEFKSFYFDWNTIGDYCASLKKIKRNISPYEFNSELEFGLTRLKKIKNNLGNTIEFSLRLKPFESLFIVLPKLYEEYCLIKNIPFNEQIDLYDFFKSEACDIKLIVVGNETGNPPRDNIKTLADTLNKQYQRLAFVNILTRNRKLYLPNSFDELTSTLEESEPKTIKSLNYDGDL